jgi:ornithine carbamoyltransferase
MPFNLKNRSFLKLLDFSPEEIQYLLQLASDLKKAKYAGLERPILKGKTLPDFEKTSTRTPCAFEVAAPRSRAHVTNIEPVSQDKGIKNP